MKYKHKRICKSLVSLLLIITFVLAPFEGVFAETGVNGESNTGDTKTKVGDYTSADGILHPLKGLAATIAILELDNTSQEYRSQIEAHNLVSPDNYWSEYRVSVVDQFLYSHPEKMSQVSEMENQALILLGQRADYNDGTKSKFKPFDACGPQKSKNYSRVYSAKGASSPGNFNIDVVYSSIKNNEVLYKSFTGGKLTFDDVNQLGVASGKVSEATDKFVKLWANTGTVDDCINGIYDGLDANSETYWYDRALRYLDFLYVIDVLCGNKYDKLIDRYLDNLNRDESDTFITVCAAANAVIEIDTTGKLYCATLPNHYAAVTGKSFEDYQTFSVTGNFIDDPTNPESYSGSLDSFVSAINGKYEEGFRDCGAYSRIATGNKNIWWWNPGDYRGAWMCQPSDINGNTTGNTGYTFLGCFTDKEPIPPPDDKKYDNEDDPDPEPPSNVPGEEDSRLKFYISATSDQYEVMKGDTVAALVDINFKQNEQAIRDFRLLWTANAAKTGDDTPLIGIHMDLLSTNEPGNNMVDAVVNNPAHKGEFNTTTNSANLTMRDVDWETALSMFYGRESFTFQDSNITVNEAKERVYNAEIGIYWIYPDGSFEGISVYGTGKRKDNYADYSAYDSVPWRPRVELPNQGYFYSQIRDNNYVEMKDNSPGSGETYEAMTGVPTTEDLYAGFGANEFMVNMYCELKSDTGKQRKYTLTYRVSECIGADIPCHRTCDGHTYNVGGCGKPMAFDPVTGAVTKSCSSGSDVTLKCSDGGPFSGVSTCECGAKSQTFTQALGGQCPDNDGTHGCVLVR